MLSQKSFWHIAGESANLAKKGVLQASVLDEWIAVYRDENGALTALRDRCLHRNARLSLGQVVKGQLVCPYHGWKYGVQGQVTAIPSEGPRFEPKASRCAPSFAVQEKDGYIHVCLENPEREPFSIPFLGQENYQHVRLKHVFKSSVQNCVENFIDIPHTTYVHPGIFRTQRAPQKISAEVEISEANVHVRYQNETNNFGFFSKFLNRTGKTIFHEDHFHFPNTTHVEYRFGKRSHFNIISQCVPVSPGEVHVYTDLTYDYGIWNLFARPFVTWTAKAIIGQDVAIMGMQSDVTGKYGELFASTRSDLQHVWIEKIYAELAAGRDPALLPARKEPVEFWI